jgi:hypothetical protein
MSGQTIAGSPVLAVEGSANSVVQGAITIASTHSADLRTRYRTALAAALERQAVSSLPGDLAAKARILRGREALLVALLRVGLGTTYERDDLQSVLYGAAGASNGCQQILGSFDADPSRVWERIQALEQAPLDATTRLLLVAGTRTADVGGLALLQVTQYELAAFQSAHWKI